MMTQPTAGFHETSSTQPTNAVTFMKRYRTKDHIAGFVVAVAMICFATTGCSDDTAKPRENGEAGKGPAVTRAAETHKDGALPEDGSAGEHSDHEEEPSEITMTPTAMKEAGITVEKVTKQPVHAVFSAPGRVVPTQNGIAHVGTIIGGRVTRLFVSEGSRVGRGAALAEIEAFDIGELKGEYLRARADAEQTKSALDRQEKLSTEKIGAQRTLEEAQAAHARAVAAQRAAETKLRALGLSPGNPGEGRAFSSRITLRSPIAGIVSRREASLGQFVEPSKDVFEVVNTGTVWVDAQVPPEMASSLAVGGVGFTRDPRGERQSGRIIFLSPSVDPESRTVTVRVELANTGNHFRPETFVTIEFERSVSGYAIAVPTEALEQEGTNYFVYREHEPNTFERVEVKIGSQTHERVIIEAGLKEGDRIAAGGVFYLKSVRQKGELSEDHD